jgi:F5/8 type C domain
MTPNESRFAKRKAFVVVGLLLVLLAGLLPACKSGRRMLGLGGGTTGNILFGKMPSKVMGVRREARLTDDIVPPRGDFWKSELTTIFASSQAYAQFDFGKPTPIAAAYLQGDNNDAYSISISDDGEHFRPLWEGGPTSGGGMQPRFADNLNVTARYVRVMAHGGDGSYALGELQLFSERPEVWPPNPVVREATPPDEVFRNKLLAFGLALSLLVVLTWRGAPLWWTLLLMVLPLAAGVDAWRSLVIAWPPGSREVSLMRAVVAAVGCLTVIRETFAPPKFLPNRRVTIGAYATCAALAILAFYNLGHPQFHDYKNDRPGFVHNFDMRVYFPIAKYFKELRFDGLYLASVAAYVDDGQGVTLESLRNQQLRSLKTHRMVQVGEVIPEIQEVQRRFTPKRWADFKKDMRYFRENMGVRDYLGSMSDHGGNATPVWFLFGHMLFAHAWASNQTLTYTALLDPILLAIALAMIWRAFGIRTALVAGIIFGANDFYMFGTCWAGATLRHDWLAYLAMGISALRLERYKLAGALLMLSGLIRAFPFFALVGVSLPAFWWVAERIRENKKLPTVAEFRQEHKALLQVALGATLTGVVLFLAASLMFGFHSWVEWFHKVALLQRDPHVNHVSLRALIAGPDGIHNRLLAARTNVFVAAIAAFSIMVLAGARRKNLAFAATLGTLMIPIAFHPANYYIHFVFVLPMLAVELRDTKKGGANWPLTPADGAIWIVLLLLCAAEYGAAIEKDLGLHFFFSAAMLIVAITALLLVTLAHDFKLALQLAPVEAGAGPGVPPAPTPELDKPREEPASEPIAAESPAPDPLPAADATPAAEAPAHDTSEAPSSEESGKEGEEPDTEDARH